MAYNRDYRAVRIDAFDVYRDLPSVRGWWDTSTLTGFANGASCARLRDRSGRGQDMRNDTGIRPVVKTTGLNGKPTLNFAGNAYLTAPTFANGGLMQSAAIPQPFTYIALVKAPSSGAGANRIVVGSSAGAQSLLTLNVYGSPQLSAGSNGATGGRDLSDDTWHVIVGVFDTSSAAVFRDGYLVASPASQSHGTNTLAQIAMGNLASGGSSGFGGEIAELIVCADRLKLDQITAVTSYLSTKWNLGLSVPQQAPVTPIYATDANGVICRVHLPQTLKATTHVVVLSHQSGGDSNWTTGYNLYPVLHALVNAGYAVVTTDQGGSNTWGNASAVTATVAAYQLAATMLSALGSVPGNVILGGASMGGVPTALAVALNAFNGVATVKACFEIDGVSSLASMYANSSYTALINTAYGVTAGTLSGATAAGATSLPTTASFPTTGTQLMVGVGTANVETVTTTGPSNGTTVPVTATTKTHASADQVTDYPTKTAGRDPVLRSANDYSSVPAWRFYLSSADTAVPRASNGDAMSALLATATTPPVDNVVRVHLSGHVSGQSAWPEDVTAFCLARQPT